jgi:Flp pilus assembly protein TadG
MYAMRHRHRSTPLAKQRGAAMVLIVAGMVALIGIAGLALDSAHGMLNKTRLQNTVDAAALGAAKTFYETAY